MKKVTIITGHYGSGKTNISVNLALELAKTGERVTVVDLDIVNYYFRTADFKKLFAENGIELISSMYANTNLDIPAISFDIERLCRDEGYLIIDVGGDDAGATALGRYKEPFEELKANNQIDMFYVINCCRYLTSTSEEALELMYEIEETARFKHTGIVNNSNLGTETTVQTAVDAVEFGKEVSKNAGIPVIFNSYPAESEKPEVEGVNFKPVINFVKPIWEQ
ncbi:MAG: cobalamin biosynthesis protein CobQ [Clostridiales bacterium]|nr:cobalamin biosynthesis protein CobQ [Clostridiales bacterium]